MNSKMFSFLSHSKSQCLPVQHNDPHSYRAYASDGVVGSHSNSSRLKCNSKCNRLLTRVQNLKSPRV